MQVCSVTRISHVAWPHGSDTWASVAWGVGGAFNANGWPAEKWAAHFMNDPACLVASQG